MGGKWALVKRVRRKTQSRQSFFFIGLNINKPRRKLIRRGKGDPQENLE